MEISPEVENLVCEYAAAQGISVNDLLARTFASSPVSEEASTLRAQFQTLFEATPLGIYLVDADFRICAVNATALPFFADIPNLIGRDFAEVIHRLWCREDAEEIIGLFRRTLETGESYQTPEWRDEPRDMGGIGQYEWRICRIPFPDGRYGVVCYSRDITAQVLARAAIAASEQERRQTLEGLRAIAARAHCLLWYAMVEDVEGTGLQWTLQVADEEAARRFLPLVMPFGHSYGRALSEARLPEDRARMAWGDNEVRAGRSYRQEFRVRDVSGRIRWLGEDVQVEEIGTKCWYAVGVCMDITARKQAEEEREKHLSEIESLNNRLKRAMTETHHRVKNNLQIIAAMIDMQGTTSEPAVSISEFARLSSSVRALSVIHEILTHGAKAGTGQATLSAKAVLERLLQELARTTVDHPLVTEIEDAHLDGGLITKLALVTNELVLNALKHGKGKIEITFTTNGNVATLQICDDGPGFPAGFDVATAANTGLELVENIVQWDLHGQVTYDNLPEGGAKITVTFPIQTGMDDTDRRD